MRAALQDNILKERLGTSLSYNLPPPVGGLNSRDSLASMKEEDALMLDNWMVRAGECQLRGGYASFSTGMSGAVKTLMQFAPMSGSKKLFAVTNAGVYDITAGGAVGAVAQALTEGYVNWLTLTNSAGTTYLWLANGTDSPKMYDGTTWSTPSITGVTSSNLIFPWLHKHRIFAVEKNSMNVWYLGPDSIQGEAKQLPLGNLFKKGGYLVSGTSWTLDSGAGPDDLFVVITSEGELAVYQGNDPATASAWSIVGVFEVGRPLGMRCFTRMAGDVSVLVESGVYPLSKLLSSGQVNFASALSNKIQPTFTTNSAKIGTTTQGWEMTIYPQFDAGLINVPNVSRATQLVINTITGAWSTFSGWDARCFIVFNGVLYWGNAATGTVYKAWDGLIVSDLGADIVASCKMAYNYFTKRSSLKHIELMRPLLAFDGNVETRMGVSADFTDTTFGSILPRQLYASGGVWDTSPWDTSAWGTLSARFKFWQAAFHPPGYALSVWLQTASLNSILSWSGTDLILAGGGLI